MHDPDLIETYLHQVAAKLSGQWSELDQLKRAVEAAEGRIQQHANRAQFHAAAPSSKTHLRTAGSPRRPATADAINIKRE